MLGSSKLEKEQDYFMNLPKYLKPNNPNTSSLRMSKVYPAPTQEKTLVKSYKSSMNWAVMLNGECLTPNTSIVHNTVRELSLSDFLETNVEPKYYLSREKAAKLFSLIAR